MNCYKTILVEVDFNGKEKKSIIKGIGNYALVPVDGVYEFGDSVRSRYE